MKKPIAYFYSETECVDVDLELIDVRDNVDESWTLRALAGQSVGMPLEDGYLASAELLCAFEWICDGNPAGKAKLAEILFNTCNDYQRALYYIIAGRGPFGAIADLPRLVALMKSRLLFGRHGVKQDLGIKMQREPYLEERPDGPLHAKDVSFELPRSWDGFIRVS